MAIGASIQDDSGTERVTVSQLLGDGTNNMAEYRAAIDGLKKARDLGQWTSRYGWIVDQPGVFVPPTMLALSSQAGWFRGRAAGPRGYCADGPCCNGPASVASRSDAGAVQP